MKRQYISPAVRVHSLVIESVLQATSPTKPEVKVNYGYKDESQSEGTDYTIPSQTDVVEPIDGTNFDVL